MCAITYRGGVGPLLLHGVCSNFRGIIITALRWKLPPSLVCLVCRDRSFKRASGDERALSRRLSHCPQSLAVNEETVQRGAREPAASNHSRSRGSMLLFVYS